jgi:hypothetical protein
MPDQNQFDPNAPYQAAQTSAPTSPGFDPSAPYQAAAPQANPADESQMFSATTGAPTPGGQSFSAPTHRYDPTTKTIQPVTSPSEVGGRAWQAAKDEAGNLVQGVVSPVKAVVNPPQDASEHAIAAIGGPGALVAYRTSRGIVEAAENLKKAKKEEFQQATADFGNALKEFHDRNYRAAASDATSTVGGILSLTGANPGVEAGRVRDIAQGTKEGGDVVTPIVKDAVDLGAAALAEKAPEAAGKVTSKISEAGKDFSASDIKPEWLTKRADTPAPQHGTPVKVESPLDSATVGSKLGGKDLSQEAVDTLQGHVGDKIAVGGTPKGKLMEAIEPVQKAIDETASKMNQKVQNAHSFTTSVAQDAVFGEGALTKDIGTMKEQLPPSVRRPLGEDIDAVMKDADKALNSTDPSEVLEYRRKLGNQIDWDKIEKNPTTPAEVQNAARVKVYRALGDKIHTEIPETVELDRKLAPNLELRSHMKSKLGERVVDDPHAATVEAQSEFKKGKTTVENTAHNEQVAKNWQRVKTGLITLGVSGGIIHEIEKFLP